jgi:hypothetical protein
MEVSGKLARKDMIALGLIIGAVMWFDYAHHRLGKNFKGLLNPS